MRRVLAPTVLVVVAGCSLFTSLDEYDGEPADAPPDASADVPPTTDGPPAADSATDSSDAAKSRSDEYRAAVMADQPIAYFRFEEESGTTAKDETGAHLGTLVFSPTLGAPGLFGPKGGIEFPIDSKAHLTVSGNDLRFAGVAPFTIEAWVFPAVFEDYQWIISTESTVNPRQGWSVLANATATPAYETWPGNARSTHLDTSPLVLSKWQHLVFTYNGAVLIAYLDGVKRETIPSTEALPDLGTLTIGCRYGDGVVNQCLDGWRVDEIAFYATPLTELRVKAHYDLGVPK
jgi:hypothetical protein